MRFHKIKGFSISEQACFLPSVKYIGHMILLIVSCWSFICSATSNQPVFFDAQLNTGAYNSTVIQDHNGFVWVGASNGLFKFNGSDYNVFHNGKKNSLPGNMIACLFEDSTGLIWIATYANGIATFNKKTGLFSNYRPLKGEAEVRPGLQNSWSNKIIVEDQDGAIWIGTTNGLYKFSKETQAFTRFGRKQGLTDTHVWSLYVDSANRLWIGTDHGGVSVLTIKDGAIKTYRHNPEEPASLGEGIVYCSFEAQNGKMWFGLSKGGINCLNEEKGIFQRYLHNPNDKTTPSANCVYTIYQDLNGFLWICGYYTAPYGIDVFDPETEQVIRTISADKKLKNSLNSNIVMDFALSKTGGIWVIDNIGGLYHYNPHRLDIKHFQKGDKKSQPNFNLACSIYEDTRGDMWFSFIGGLNRLNRSTGEFTFYAKNLLDRKALQADYPLSVLEDRQGRFWITTNDGVISLFDREAECVVKRYRDPKLDHGARVLIEDDIEDGIFWFGTEGYGMGRFNANDGSYRHYNKGAGREGALSSDSLNQILPDGKELYIVTNGGGLNIFNTVTEKFTCYMHTKSDEKSLSSNMLRCIYKDSKGRIWITTDGGGLNQFFAKAGTFKVYGEDEGFSTLILSTILEDSFGHLWITSSSGVFRFDPESGKVIRRYSKGDGLCSEAYSQFAKSCYKSRDGCFWLSGTEGTSVFNPDKLENYNYSPPLYFSAITQGGTPINTSYSPESIKEITLDWKQNFFEFEMASLNYITPSNRKYRFQLNGWDENWFTSGEQRTGRYSGLTGGTYTLRAICTNSDGSWNYDNELRLKVIVIPPFWKTTIFYCVCFFAVLLIMSAIIYNFNNLNNEISERKNAEENLRVTLDCVSDAVIAVDKEGSILQMNPVAEALVKRTFASAQGAPLNSIYNVETLDGVEYNYFDALLKGDIDYQETVDAVFRSHCGVRREVTHRAMRTIHKDNRSNEKTVIVVRDETARNALKDRDQHARKMESVGQLAGGVAHDFNNILAGILGMSQLITIKAPHDSKIYNYAESIVQIARRASELTQKLLSFSRKGNSVLLSIDLHERMAEVIEILKRSIDKKIEIVLHTNAENSIVVGDSSELQNALLNLCVNARDAMPAGGQLVLTTENVSLDDAAVEKKNIKLTAGNYIKVEVIDTGCGISSEVIDKIFEPFFTTKPLGKGTGLGLAAVYGCITNHNGTITVSSTLERGSTFTIYLPTTANMKKDDKTFPIDSYDITIDNSLDEEQYVLVVDDEEFVRESVVSLLKHMGFKTISADNGAQAIKIFNNRHSSISFVILDMLMPVMNGKETFYEMKKIDPEVQVIMCSGYTQNIPINDLRDDGLRGFINKPFTLNELTKTIEELNTIKDSV